MPHLSWIEKRRTCTPHRGHLLAGRWHEFSGRVLVLSDLDITLFVLLLGLRVVASPHLGAAIILCGQHFPARLPISAVVMTGVVVQMRVRTQGGCEQTSEEGCL